MSAALVLKNFTGVPPEQLLERMIELWLYAEEKRLNPDRRSGAGRRTGTASLPRSLGSRGSASGGALASELEPQ